jgi:ribosomal protein L17
MHCNVTSVKKYKDEIFSRFNTFDILSINETNLKPQQFFSFPGYDIFRNDRPVKQGGGVLLAVRNNIKCFEIFNKTIGDNETIAVQIETSRGYLLVASVYIPPTVKVQHEVFEHIYSLNNNCLILGDFNAALHSMGSKKTNAKGVQLQQILDEGYLQCIDNDLTTYTRNNYEEKIDWILASQPTILFINNVETHSPLGSKDDHKPLTFNLNMSADLKPVSPRLSYNFNETNWKLYRNKLNGLLDKIDIKQTITTKQQIESYAATITKCITLATKAAIPPANESLKTLKISKATKKLIQDKHRAYRQWRKTNKDTDKKEYYNNRRELLANSLRNDRIGRLNQMMSSLCANKMHSTKVWATVRKFHNKRTKQSYAGELIYQNDIASTDYQKANLFASYFENEIFIEKPDLLPFHDQIRRQVEIIERRFSMKKPTNKNK